MTAKKKAKPSEQRQINRWRAEVYFMLGFPALRIASLLQISVGSVHRMIADGQLQDQRTDYNRRLAALLRLTASAPPGFSPFIQAALGKLVAASSVHRYANGYDDGIKVSAAEADCRARLLRDLKATAEVPKLEQEHLVIMEKTGRQVVARNIAHCPLEMLLSRGVIPQWAYDAGTRLRSDFDQATIGALKAFNPMKDVVDGGFPSNTISDGQAYALEALSEAKAAVSIVCHPSDFQTVWSIIDAAVIKGSSVRQWAEFAKPATGSGGKVPYKNRHIQWLMFGLEPIAFVYSLCPDGPINRRLTNIERVYGKLRKFKERVDAL